MEIRNKLTVARGDDGGKRGWIVEEHVWKTHGQSQRGLGLRVGGGVGWVWGNGAGKMETTVLERQ